MMKSYTLTNISGIASAILSGLGFIVALIIVPLVRVLPEIIGLPIFLILMPGMVGLAASTTVVALSQPRWDAILALHPDGETLLLSNGRDGFWRSKLPSEPVFYSTSGGTSR